MTALLASDGIVLTQRKRGSTLSTVVLDAKRLVGDLAESGVRDGRGDTEPFSLW